MIDSEHHLGQQLSLQERIINVVNYHFRSLSERFSPLQPLYIRVRQLHGQMAIDRALYQMHQITMEKPKII